MNKKQEMVNDIFRQQDEAKTISYFTELAKRFGNDVRTLNWGSKTSQERRFAVLANIGNLNNTSILDVGCGLGDFYAWLNDQHIKAEYCGIDITPKLIEMACERFPEASFEVGGLMNMTRDTSEFDFIFASGIFYLMRDHPFYYMTKMIAKMFELCRVGVAFNSLSEWAIDKDVEEFYADPHSVIEFCRSLSPSVVLRHDYHPSDFTIYLYKEKSIK